MMHVHPAVPLAGKIFDIRHCSQTSQPNSFIPDQRYIDSAHFILTVVSLIITEIHKVGVSM